MTRKEAIAKLQGVVEDQNQQCERLIREACDNNLTDESMITVKRTFEQKKQYINGISYALSVMHECSQQANVQEVIKDIDEQIAKENKCMEDYLFDSPNYQRASERRKAYMDCKRMISQAVQIETLPDEKLISLLNQWEENLQLDVRANMIGSVPYTYASGQIAVIREIRKLIYDSVSYKRKMNTIKNFIQHKRKSLDNNNPESIPHEAVPLLRFAYTQILNEMDKYL